MSSRPTAWKRKEEANRDTVAEARALLYAKIHAALGWGLGLSSGTWVTTIAERRNSASTSGTNTSTAATPST